MNGQIVCACRPNHTIISPRQTCPVRGSAGRTSFLARQDRLTMIRTADAAFQSAINALALPAIAIGHRLISPGDEDALLPEEAPAFAASVVTVRRASGAARIVARELLMRLGVP